MDALTVLWTQADDQTKAQLALSFLTNMRKDAGQDFDMKLETNDDEEYRIDISHLDKGPSRIIAAAIRYKGVTYTGSRHGHIIRSMVEVTTLKDMLKDKVTDNMQGFIDQYGRWYSREDSREIAIKANQIKPDHGTLYSEDLW